MTAFTSRRLKQAPSDTELSENRDTDLSLRSLQLWEAEEDTETDNPLRRDNERIQERELKLTAAKVMEDGGLLMGPCASWGSYFDILIAE